MDNENMALDIVTSRFERTINRLWILCMLLLVLLVGSNCYWFWYESQFTDVLTIEQDAEFNDGNVVLNGTGEVSIYGESTSESNQN